MWRDKRRHNNQPGQTREVNWRWTPRLAVGRQEAEEEGYFYQAVECVFDQICSLGLFVIRYVMFLCFWVQFGTKQTKCVFAYVMLNIICLYVFMCLGMLHFPLIKIILFHFGILSLYSCALGGVAVAVTVEWWWRWSGGGGGVGEGSGGEGCGGKGGCGSSGGRMVLKWRSSGGGGCVAVVVKWRWQSSGNGG